MRGMILAAGLGTRLRPFSKHLPKPLFPVLGITALEWAIRRLSMVGAGLAVVNTHYRSQQVEAFIRTADLPIPVNISHENELAGTGGGIAAAKKWLDNDDHFILHNSDAFITLEPAQLVRRFNELKPAVMLMVTKDPSRAKAHVVGVVPGDSRLCITTLHAKPGDGLDRYMYTGVAVISRRIFDFLPKGPSCLVKSGLEPMIDAGLPVLACNYNGTFVDIGTASGLLQAQATALEHTPGIFQDNGLRPPFQAKPGIFCMDKLPKNVQAKAPVFVGRGFQAKGTVTLGPNAFISDNVTITGPATIKNCLVLPNADVSGRQNGPVAG